MLVPYWWMIMMSFKPRRQTISRIESRFKTLSQRQNLNPIIRNRIEDREIRRQQRTEKLARRAKQRQLSRATFEQTLAQPLAARQTGVSRSRSQAKGFDTDVASSYLWRLKYNDQTEELDAWFNSGAVYRYSKVPFHVVLAVVEGRDNPETSGKNEYGAWTETKSPSVGATFRKRIILGGYAYVKIGQMSARPRILRSGAVV